MDDDELITACIRNPGAVVLTQAARLAHGAGPWRTPFRPSTKLAAASALSHEYSVSTANPTGHALGVPSRAYPREARSK